MVYYARSPGPSGDPQVLKDHLQNVSALAERFAVEAGLPDGLGHWAGRLHDLGKYSDEFQRHLLRRDRDHVEHAAHGACIAAEHRAIELAFAVAAHHGGLGSPEDIRKLPGREEETVGLVPRPTVGSRTKEMVDRALNDGAFVGGPPATSGDADRLTLELRIRMLLSCLADADRLDAQHWTTPKDTEERSVPALDPGRGLQSLSAYLERRRESSKGSADVNHARDDVFQAALAAGSRPAGFFSLTVPTGGGKTLASLAFALRHAQEHGLRRVIFVLPFLAIIEQNAQVLQDAVGSQTLLEHHSGLQRRPDGDDAQDLLSVRRRLLAENWDAPLIVTTTVQFFESLFSNHPTDLRKVHNIARSVVIFDEAQTFPPTMLRPLVGMLQQLKDEYRCSFVFCTATQPAFTREIRAAEGTAPLIPPDQVHEIANDPRGLFDRLKRVMVAWPAKAESAAPAAVATGMAQAPGRQALAVVNTKRQAAQLYRALLAYDAEAIHLSTRLCSAHRQVIFSGIRDRLERGEPCLVASTQLVEAGVDVDFPAVWRAFGPLDSIAQAAGRCNREGRRDFGRVTVFVPEDDTLPGDTYARATSITRTMLDYHGGIDIHDPEVYAEYFQRFYNVNDLDSKKVDASRNALNFRDVDRDFEIIEKNTTPVLVTYRQGSGWIERIERATPSTPLWPREVREMQPFMVALYGGELSKAITAGAVRLDEASGIHLMARDATYDARLGLILPGDPLED